MCMCVYECVRKQKYLFGVVAGAQFGNKFTGGRVESMGFDWVSQGWVRRLKFLGSDGGVGG